ncbi:MAG: LamG domain-containing protein, partial [Planctomycetes bacterium]|nr:LamG domain-containing protein [Planctomycetota bacterium]
SFTTLPDIPITDPTLVGWWTFDEGEGDTAFDWSGHGNHGTLIDDPQWVPGQIGGALDFDGVDDYVDFGNPPGWPSGLSARSMCGWGKTDTVAAGFRWIAAYGSPGTGQAMFIGMNADDLFGGGYGDDVQWNDFWEVGVWHHICLTYDGTTARLYADGSEVASAAKNWNLVLSRAHIGRQVNDTTEFWDGSVDDVRIYSRALSQAEILHLVDPAKAWNPSPADGEYDVALNPTLIWSPGTDPDTGTDYTRHDLYFGTDFDDVNSATVPTITLTDVNEFTAPALDYYGRYYWRVNEVNAGGEEVTGDVWTFKAIYDPANIVDPNLLAWYKLDGDANDSSGYGRDGTENGGPSYVGGFDGDAINFDGVDDYVNVETPVGISGNAPRTIAGWAKANADVASLGWTNVFGFCPAWHGTGQYFDIEKRGGENQYCIHVHGADWILLDVDLEWHHFAVTYDGTDGSAYVDGQWVVTVGGGGATLETVDNIRMGHRPTEGTYFPGSVDDVRIYDYALSAEEVGKVMRGNLAFAWKPDPMHGATGVVRNPTLSWMPGDYALPTNGHYVYFGADDPANLALVASQPQSPNNYSPGALDLGTTYYWAVDEANTAAPGGVDAGNIWTFTTIDFLVLDDMESYENDPNWIFDTWKEGLGDADCTGGNGTGSALSMSASIYLGGYQSMEYVYDNDGTITNPCSGEQEARAFYSVATANIADLASGIGSDWTVAGAEALVLQFYGMTGNSIESMWVELTDGAGGKATVNYGDYADENPTDINETSWHEWNIDLQDFEDGGVNLANVSSIAIGFGSPIATMPGGSGLMYFDDIRLYAPRCILSRREADFALLDFAPEGDPNGDCVVNYKELEIMSRDWLLGDATVNPVAPNSVALAAWFEFENDANDSSGNGNHGTENGMPFYTPGMAGYGQAISLDGADDWVDVGGVGISGAAPRTIAGWAKANSLVMADWTNVFGFTGPSGAAGHFDIEVVGGTATTTSGYYGLHRYGTENDIFDVDLEWHHLAATYDGTTAAWYGDGQLIGSVAVAINTPDNVHVGKRDDNSNFFSGLVDDVRIYSYALSHNEIVSLYGDDPLYIPLTSAANISDNEPVNEKKVNFLDYAMLMQRWLDEDLFP